MGYKSYTAKRKSLRTPAPIKQRLTFSKDHQHRLSEWNNVIWSDEAHFKVLNYKNGTFVRRLKSGSNEPLNFTPHVQGGGGSVNVCGCISRGARDSLMIYSGRLSGAAYIEIIKDALPIFIENAFDAGNNNWTYMQDNAPVHTSKYSMK